jgi:hypothetical protein
MEAVKPLVVSVLGATAMPNPTLHRPIEVVSPEV